MRRISIPLLAAALAIIPGACERPPETGKTLPDAAPSATPTPEATETPAPETIPAAIQGRWALVAADCEPGRADAKGLLEISPTTLKFYESLGTLAKVSEAGPTRIDANFDFSGEGMTWLRRMTLDVQDEGDTLIRREYSAGAMPGPLRYSRCP